MFKIKYKIQKIYPKYHGKILMSTETHYKIMCVDIEKKVYNFHYNRVDNGLPCVIEGMSERTIEHLIEKDAWILKDGV